MKLLFVHSHKFKYAQDGNVYSEGQFPYKVFKERYLLYFKKMIVAGRAEKLNDNNGYNLSSGPYVEHQILPDLSTVKGRSKNVSQLKKKLVTLIKESDLLIARMPSMHAYYAIKIAIKLNKPYVVEVVGDGFIALWTHGSIYGKVLAPLTYLKHRKIIKKAPYLIYVTESYLQKRYPHNKHAITINASNVDLPSFNNSILKDRMEQVRKESIIKEVYKIGLIGSYSSKYKGIDTAIKSIKILQKKGLNCKLYVLGSGENKWLMDIAKKSGVEDSVFFEGTLPGGQQVLHWLDTLDLYIQPSLTEGLPRALIEAMSRALPCVGSSVGGIPELLETEYIHSPKSIEELSEKIENLLLNQREMLDQSKKNFYRAKDYTSEVLNARRKKFWEKVIEKELTK